MASPPHAADRSDVAFGWRVLDVSSRPRQRLGLGRVVRIGAPAAPRSAAGVAARRRAGAARLAQLPRFDPFLFKEGELSTENYRELADTPLVREVFVRTVVMALVTTAIAVALRVPIAHTS